MRPPDAPVWLSSLPVGRTALGWTWGARAAAFLSVREGMARKKSTRRA